MTCSGCFCDVAVRCVVVVAGDRGGGLVVVANGSGVEFGGVVFTCALQLLW